ncbi:MAG: response regulator, partial [Janthinobacterium lividum]
GTWKDLTDSVNFMAANLTAQVRGIAGVVNAVANGDLKKKLTVAARGEIATLANTINEMTDTLAVFADQATTVAREVGVEGKLGGQASVPGAAGTWKDLTENVNQLAANLSTQVRAIAEVATAVTRGDLSRSIQVQAKGEVSDLKDNINEMIRNLKETTQKNAQQDWLKTNLARFTRLLQGQSDLETVTSLILSELAPLVSAQHGMFYLMDGSAGDPFLCMSASYGAGGRGELPVAFAPGNGLVGQCALEKRRIWLTNVPRGYISVTSGLGSAAPANIVVLPILFDGQVKAVIEIASLNRFTDTHISFLDQLMESIGVVLNTIETNSRTESLLTQSQSLAQELQQTNQELAEKARLLSEQNIEVERKNSEVEHAKLELEEKAAQLALSSKYKSEFLANMSHELRTPLNSLLILAQQLGDNPDGNLSGGQVEYAKTIYGSGSDLLILINDILDLAKIESGTVTLDVSEYRFATLRDYVERTFRHMAQARQLQFTVELAADLPLATMTDTTRLQQILKNLLSNAFKFTLHGEVALHIGLASGGWSVDHPTLSRARSVLAFSVSDTGVGIAADKLQLIFEAFQQADGGTARKYGGTGLGLSISRELARLLDGEIRVRSEVGEGSIFTLYVPCVPAAVEVNAGAAASGDEQAISPAGMPLAGSTTSTTTMPAASATALPTVSSTASDAMTPTGASHGDARRTAVPDETAEGKAAGRADIAGYGEAQPALTAEQSERDARAIQADLAGHQVLIVDDDLRNIFALSSVLARQKMKVLFAENGRDGIAMLQNNPGIEIVLMDIMMPEMDGYDTTRAIRSLDAFQQLPIITLTAKAMKGDREKCLAAGASDYITKPVDVPKLLAMMRHWINAD